MNESSRQRRPAVKDQGRRGTCVAFAITAGHEMVRGIDVDLSEEFLHWAAKQRDGFPSSVDGTTLAAAAQALEEVGQPREILWPYDQHRDPRASDYVPSSDARREAALYRLPDSEVLRMASDAVRDALDRGMGVALGVRLYATWYRPEADGTIAMPIAGASSFGGHAVLVVGYEERGVEGTYFTIRNSWGSAWADGGYAALPAAYVDAHAIEVWGLPKSEEPDDASNPG